MPVAVNTIVANVREILLDPAGVRWTTTELVGWLNSGQNDIVARKPDASATNARVLLVQGTRQTLPTAGQRLLDVVRNTNSDGTEPGRAIRLVDRSEIDAAYPRWHSPDVSGGARHGSEVKNYSYSENDPRTYYVFPGVLAADTVYADVVYSVTPAAASAGGNISIADYYAEALTNYILYRACMKESEFGSADARGQLYLQLYLSAVGDDIKIAKTSSPNMRRTGTEGGKS